MSCTGTPFLLSMLVDQGTQSFRPPLCYFRLRRGQHPKERIALQATLIVNGPGRSVLSLSLFSFTPPPDLPLSLLRPPCPSSSTPSISHWKNLTPSAAANRGTGGVLKDGALEQAIDFALESFDTPRGSMLRRWDAGGYNTQAKHLGIAPAVKQGPLPSFVPIIGVDIWEHTFYLQYLNVKADDLTAIWSVINFEGAEARYLEASGASKLKAPSCVQC
ncbi:hypothetical protein FA13DRAFT_1775828 [Coprinellus micaceus]|uniref:superoxide dismutase n=1 Tax=Coprinellus micaceus TaxID=71717 RepID=A0A4Y7T3P5_COPMI|nr:hypothetical protein FA13DRAFT_1775828 [Coprinellus micaceus]